MDKTEFNAWVKDMEEREGESTVSEIEIGLRVFYICLTFGFLTLLTVAVVFWQFFSGKDD